MMLFIFLNYLLWDRENKIDNDKSKDASIAALGRELKNLDSANIILRERNTKFESDIKAFEDRINENQNEKAKLSSQLAQRNETINQIKQTADLNLPQTAILKWGEAFEKSQYEAAYLLQLPTAFGQQLSLDDYVKLCKSKLKSFKILSVKPFIENTPEERKGEILFKVSLDVKRVTESGKFLFEDGISERIFSVIFLKEKNAWIIGDIQ